MPRRVPFVLLAGIGLAGLSQGAPPPSHADSQSAPRTGAPRTARERRVDQDKLDELRRDMLSRDAGDRRRAVRKAAQIGGPEALQFVLDALGDERGQVADSAETMLVEHFAADAPEALHGKLGLGSKDVWRRVRAVETLAQLGAHLDTKALVRCLDRREPRLAWTTLVALEKAGDGAAFGWDERDRGRIVKKLRPLLKRSAGDELQARALLALGAVDPDAAAEFQPGATAGPRLRAAALSLALGRAEPGALEALAAAVSDEEPALRAFVLEEVARGRADRAVLKAVVARIENEPRPCVAERVVWALRRATGLRHGANVRAWGRAIDDLPPDWTPDVRAEETAGRGASDAGSVGAIALGGLDPRSDRVAVVVDFSGSLWRKRADGTRRKDALDPEVSAYLNRLGEGTRFVVVPFTGELHPLSDGPMDATKRNLKRIRADFIASKAYGSGDAYGAIEYALGYDEIDRVVVVTDGAPTGGRRWELDRIVGLVLERTRLRPVTFDVLLEGAPKGLARRWQRLAERTGGRFVAVDAQR